MTLDVRRIRFEFEDDVDFLWNPSDPGFSAQMNATSIIAIGFEKMIVSATREALPHITDPDVAQEARDFLSQEAQHATAHKQHMRALIKRYPGLQETLDAVIAAFDKLDSRSLRYRLAYIADLEAPFTPNFKVMLDHHEQLFSGGDERVGSLFLWHFVEEVEHRSSALVVYDAVVKHPTYRLAVLPSVLRHLAGIMTIIGEGFYTHVPYEERKMDTRLLDPKFALKKSLRAKFSRNKRSAAKPESPGGSRALPKEERKEAFRRIIASQAPKHDPEHQPLPAFVDEWMAAYESGADVTRWYSSAQQSS